MDKKDAEDIKYSQLTSFIYQDLSWGPLYREKDGEVIINADNQAAKYIMESLDIMKISRLNLKEKKFLILGLEEKADFLQSTVQKLHILILLKTLLKV